MLILARQTDLSENDLTTLPTPEHNTLLLKNHKQTVLLSVLPTTPIPEIKSLLLAAIKSLNIDSIGNQSVPEAAEDIEFGILKNKKDPGEGWVPLIIKETDSGDGKLGKKKPAGKKNLLNESSAGAGLVDGSIIAFRFKTKDQPVEVEDDDEMELEADPGWIVIMPSYEDEAE